LAACWTGKAYSSLRISTSSFATAKPTIILNIVFLEPRYNPTNGGDPTETSDQHPDHDVEAREQLIHDVFKAISSRQEIWTSTLFDATQLAIPIARRWKKGAAHSEVLAALRRSTIGPQSLSKGLQPWVPSPDPGI
jgi:hypothetical protein